MLTVVMVLRGGGEFGREHVARLCEQVRRWLDMPHRIVILTDTQPAQDAIDDVAGEDYARLVHQWPGWWSMLEMYRVPGPAIYLDLDTTVRGPLDPLAERAQKLERNEAILLRPLSLNRPATSHTPMGTGLVAWGPESGMRVVYRCMQSVIANGGRFNADRQFGTLLRAGTLLTGDGASYRDDQPFTCHKARGAGINLLAVQDLMPGYVVSYKRNWRRRPDNHADTAAVVLFHGSPRPWQVNEIQPMSEEQAQAVRERWAGRQSKVATP